MESLIVSGNDMLAYLHRFSRFEQRGFTLIELLVTLAIIATLLSLALPRYFGSLDKTKEAVLLHDLRSTREAIDKYYSDTGKYPDTLEDLVQKKYLRSTPIDPITESTETWIVIAPDDPEKGGLSDIRSGAEGYGKDGTLYREW